MRRFLAVLAVTLVSTMWAGPVGAARPVAATPKLAAQGHQGPCTDNVGVTIVVDFQDLGGGVNVRCAPTAPTSGLQALQLAGVNYQTAARSPGFLCKIAGQPSNDPCQVASPASAYWSYWIAPRGGNWCYSNLGAGNRKPPPGSIEGWSFSLNRTAGAVPRPRYTPPPPIPGTTPSPIPASHCTTPRGVEPTVPQPPPTRPPATQPPATRPPATQPSGPGAAPRSPGATPAPGTPDPGSRGTDGSGSRDEGDDDDDGDERDDAGTDADDDDAPGDPDGDDDGDGDDAEDDGGDADDPDGDDASDPGDDGSETAAGPDPGVPMGEVDLTDDGTSDGSPTGVIVTVLILLAVGAGGAWRYLATRRSAPTP